jgi:hypothetical protein
MPIAVVDVGGERKYCLRGGAFVTDFILSWFRYGIGGGGSGEVDMDGVDDALTVSALPSDGRTGNLPTGRAGRGVSAFPSLSRWLV